jgi:hypothetical protein
MRHFVKQPSLGFVSIPGVGPLKEGQVLVGEGFAQYAPKFLMEVPGPRQAPVRAPKMLVEVPDPPTPPKGPTLLTEPAPFVVSDSPVQSDQSGSSEQELNEATPVKRRPGRPRKYPLPTPTPDEQF